MSDRTQKGVTQRLLRCYELERYDLHRLFSVELDPVHLVCALHEVFIVYGFSHTAVDVRRGNPSLSVTPSTCELSAETSE